MVRVRGWVIYFVYKGPHNDKSKRMHVSVCVQMWVM